MATVSEDDKLKIAAFAERVACKPVLCSLISVVEQFAQAKAKANLIDRIKTFIVHDTCGRIILDLGAEYDNHSLCIALTLCDRQYQTSIAVPNERMGPTLYTHYNQLKSLATTFWDAMLMQPAISQLMQDINEHSSGAPIGRLIVDPNNPTTLYFRPDSSKRVGIFCWYEKDGQPLKKASEHKH